MSKLFLVAILLGTSCKPYRVGDDSQNPPPAGGGVYQPPPPRHVTGDGAIGVPSGGWGGAGGSGGVGGSGGGPASPDAAAPRDAAADRSVQDAPIAQLDASQSADAAVTGCVACDLLTQDCSASQACYPSGAGRGCCQLPEAVAGPGQTCFDGNQCDKGWACVGGIDGSFCREICSTASPMCVGCKALGGYPGVGYCAP